jgi:hypothetical protein
MVNILKTRSHEANSHLHEKFAEHSAAKKGTSPIMYKHDHLIIPGVMHINTHNKGCTINVLKQ